MGERGLHMGAVLLLLQPPPAQGGVPQLQACGQGHGDGGGQGVSGFSDGLR